MKVVITDFPDSMMPEHDYEKQILTRGLPGCEVAVYPYRGDKAELLRILSDAAAILTAFLPIDKEIMDAAPGLKCISLNATGYDNVDLGEATKRGIGVFPVGEYCTEDVAEHTIAVMLAMAKNLKHYSADIDVRHVWQFDSAEAMMRVEEMTLGIFGFGKIGRCVARKAQGLGMKVIACDPYADAGRAGEMNIPLVQADEIYANAHVISNNMKQNETNVKMFSASAFKKMRQRPIFINMGRGASVVEEDLVTALDTGSIRGAALDVLADETPNLKDHPLAKRENVIITPHAAFYTTTSIIRLQEISCKNIVYYMKGELDKVFKLVN
ncbi:3-phosphoglycerate dehydrogenase [Spirochaetia bacterium]|nr:3-phosphoglycerate dehydrogenase [Spirochaetia bacterium]